MLPHNSLYDTDIHPKKLATEFNPKLTTYSFTNIAANKALFHSDAGPASQIQSRPKPPISGNQANVETTEEEQAQPAPPPTH